MTPRIRFGIRARLWIALIVVASMTVVASGVAWISSERSGRVMATVVDGEVPSLMALSSLNQRISQLLSTAPNISFVDDQLEMREQIRRTSEAEQALARAVDEVRDQLGETPELRTIELTATRAGVQLQILLSAMEYSLRLRSRYLALAEQLDVLQQEYRVVIGVETSRTMDDIRLLTEVNRAMIILGEVWQARSSSQIDALHQRIATILNGLQKMSAKSSATVGPSGGLSVSRDMVPFFNRLHWLALGEGNLFDLKKRDLQARAVAADRLASIQPLASQLDQDLRAVMMVSRDHIHQGHQTVVQTLDRSKIVLALSSLCSLLVAVIIGWRYVGVSVIGRLKRLATSMHAIANGDLQAPIPIGGKDEVSDMARALVVFRDALGHVQHLATHDTLTGLANRRLVEERLNRLLNDPDACGAVIFINLCGFKDINDTFGHAVGDQMLLVLADRLRWVARRMDVAGRLGGDDFVLVLPGVVTDDQVETYLRGLEPMLSAVIPLDVIDIEAQSSLGIARYPADAGTAEGLLHCAETAMQHATSAQRMAAFYTVEMGRHVLQRKAIRSDLRQGIEGGQLELVYQPKIDLRSGRINGMEALVRWNHPERGRISPLDFIPVAEQSGLILPLGEWVLYEGCRQARQWQQDGLGDLRVAINMSPVQVLRHDVVSQVRTALQSTGLPPNLLEIEITEGVLMQEETRALQRLRALRDLGVHLAIDDFGTGYSSLSYLRTLPVTSLKIDQSFVRNLSSNPEDARLNRVIIGMAHDFGLEVVAEGIETLDHATFLRNEGCDLGQGYFYSRPLDVDAFRTLLTSDCHWIPGVSGGHGLPQSSNDGVLVPYVQGM